MTTKFEEVDVFDVAVADLTDTDTKLPPMYALIMHNDDYTTMEFVVWVLVSVLGLSESRAISLMLEIHHQGLAKVAVLPKELAEMKLQKILQLAEQEEFPLLVTLQAQ